MELKLHLLTKCMWKYCQQNGSHFMQASMGLGMKRQHMLPLVCTVHTGLKCHHCLCLLVGCCSSIWYNPRSEAGQVRQVSHRILHSNSKLQRKIMHVITKKKYLKKNTLKFCTGKSCRCLCKILWWLDSYISSCSKHIYATFLPKFCETGWWEPWWLNVIRIPEAFRGLQNIHVMRELNTYDRAS